MLIDQTYGKSLIVIKNATSHLGRKKKYKPSF